MNRRYGYQEPFKFVTQHQIREGFDQSDCTGYTTEESCKPVYTGDLPVSGGCKWLSNNKCYPNTINAGIKCPMATTQLDCTNVGVYHDVNKPVCTWVNNYQPPPDPEGTTNRCLKYESNSVCVDSNKVPSPTP